MYRAYLRRTGRPAATQKRLSPVGAEDSMFAAAVVALAGPRREHEQELCTLSLATAALVGRERHEGARLGIELSPAASILACPVHDDDEGVLLDLVIEPLPRVEADQDGAALVAGVEDDRRSAAVGSLDLGQVPAPHAPIVTGPESRGTPVRLGP